ncbi:MAG: PD-(D/E)XK nuclease family protein [Actinobacteria bacterium]|nr:MAG: PD-(D/E)XK nuclease family protein [Actinomycetota bacterium]
MASGPPAVRAFSLSARSSSIRSAVPGGAGSAAPASSSRSCRARSSRVSAMGVLPARVYPLRRSIRLIDGLAARRLRTWAAMSVGGPTLQPVDLTPMQLRTLRDLIAADPVPADPSPFERIRSLLEDRLAPLRRHVGGPVWLGKHRLTDFRRCPGSFAAGLLGEGQPFQHSSRTSAGALFHKSIELDVVTGRSADPQSICERAADRLSDGDAAFGRYWSGLDALARGEVVAEAGRHLILFRESFPPLLRRWAPQPELPLKALLADGRVILSGKPDLVLGLPRRLIIDFKSGQAWPEHPEDMRFYALVHLLRTGLPPYRVATFFLDSGEWQAEDVGEETLEHAADRVAAAALAAFSFVDGGRPDLHPGRHCDWCPRRASCPAASAWFAQDVTGETSAMHGLLPSGEPTYRSATLDPGSARRGDGAGSLRDRDDPPAGRGPPLDVRPGHPAGPVR